jgi:DNA-directed RNA polymerase subunit RPC12/RpoP
MFYYICARCNHITNQKIEMKRHLEKNNICKINNINNILSDKELYNKSLEKQEKLNENNTKKEYICDKCNKHFSNKGNLNKHLKVVCNSIKIENNMNNVQNIGVQNIININLGMVKGFDQDWDVTSNIKVYIKFILIF